jgi:Fe-S-cluster-containing hydrogenase component 2
MTRDIIEIKEELCNGCGDCAIGCAEGAIQIIDGKAKLVREEFCDGFGDCVGVCPTGALTVVKRAAPAFDEQATIINLLATQGPEAVRRYQEAQDRHATSESDGHGNAADAARIPVMPMMAQGGHHHGGGCPGSMQRELRRAQPQTAGTPAPAMHAPHAPATPARSAAPSQTIIPSELSQWPVQLHLVQPGAPFFRNRELVVMSTCGPIASAEVHQRYLRDRGVVVACPKLDNTAPYAQKLAAIFSDATIPKAIVVIMEVPCCRGLTQIVRQAHAASGRTDLVVEEHILSLEGEIIAVNSIGN